MLAPSGVGGQTTPTNAFKAEIAIMSAGFRASSISKLKVVPNVTVINLNFSTTRRYGGNHPSPSDLKVSVSKNYKGIKRLQAALAANPATRTALSRRHVGVNRVVGIDIYSSDSMVPGGFEVTS
jgi:hypothetical protein